ncbi:MAG: hypothetical protein V1921_01960 [Candidatus Altiarchaeota archaeon]
MAYTYDLRALMLYSTLTLVLTYPLIANLESKLVGDYDVYSNVWNLWWMKKSLLELRENPYFTRYLFHPTGVSLGMHTLGPYNGILGIILQERFNLIGSYNILVLLSFLIAAYGMFLLAYYLIGDKISAFVAGIIFAFSPYHYAEALAGHLNLLSIQWIPFYVLYLLKMRGDSNWKNVVLSSFFLLLVALCSWQYMGFMLLTAFLFSAHFYREGDIGFVKNTVKSTFLFAILVAPFFYPTLKIILAGEARRSSLYAIICYSSDMFSYLLPSQFHPLFGWFGNAAHRMLSSEKNVGYVMPVGFTVLFLSLYNMKGSGILRTKMESLHTFAGALPGGNRTLLVSSVMLLISWVLLFGDTLVRALFVVLFIVLAYLSFSLYIRRLIGLWGMILTVFTILSFGPILFILGEPTIFLPFILLQKLPVFSIFRVPERFAVMVMLSLSVLAGHGINRMLSKTTHKNLLGFIISSLILFEFLTVPLNLTTPPTEEFYLTLADGQDYAILDVPIAPQRLALDDGRVLEYGIPEYMYYQTVHQRPIVGGYVSYPSRTALGFMQDSPVFGPLNDLDHKNLTGDWVEAFLPAMREYNIGYVVVHHDVLLTDLYENGTDEKISAFMQKAFRNQSPYYSNERILVYRT